MKKNAIIDLIVAITATPLLTIGFFGILFGGALVKVLSTVGLLLLIVVTLRFYRDRPVYL